MKRMILIVVLAAVMLAGALTAAWAAPAAAGFGGLYCPGTCCPCETGCSKPCVHEWELVSCPFFPTCRVG